MRAGHLQDKNLCCLYYCYESEEIRAIGTPLASATASLIDQRIKAYNLIRPLEITSVVLLHDALALLTMVIAIVLGFGMPPTAVYIILVAIVVPPLVDLGVQPIAAHMFLFFFSTLAALTPPVAITAFAAAIAKANPNLTGMTSFRLAIIGYIIPFMLVFSPSLLLQGEIPQVILSIITALIGVGCLVAGIEGYLFTNWNKGARLLLVISSLLLLAGGLKTDLIALFLILVSVALQKVIKFQSTTKKTLMKKAE